jgi:hypothetical protein
MSKECGAEFDISAKGVSRLKELCSKCHGIAIDYLLADGIGPLTATAYASGVAEVLKNKIKFPSHFKTRFPYVFPPPFPFSFSFSFLFLSPFPISFSFFLFPFSFSYSFFLFLFPISLFPFPFFLFPFSFLLSP